MFLNITLLILSLVAIILFDAPRLIRRKMWRELCAFAMLLAIGYILAFLRVLEVIVL